MNCRPMSSMPSSDTTTVSAGEDHRAAGGVHGADGGLLERLPGAEVLAVPGDDEQRVVDADGEAEHRAEGGGEVGDGEPRC